MSNKLKNKLGKKPFAMIVTAVLMLAVLIMATPAAFFASISSEWKARGQINSVSKNLDVDASKEELIKIAKNDRILEIIAVEQNGAIIYTLKNMSLFADVNATVAYDKETGLIKFDGTRVSYFQRNSVLASLLELDDDDDWDYDDDDDRIPHFDYKFVEDNTYQTIAMTDSQGRSIYIVCTQDSHVGFILFVVLSSIAWAVLIIYAIITIAFILAKILMPACPSCGAIQRIGNKHCTKCGISLEPRRCPNCHCKAKKQDIACATCGTKLD